MWRGRKDMEANKSFILRQRVKQAKFVADKQLANDPKYVMGRLFGIGKKFESDAPQVKTLLQRFKGTKVAGKAGDKMSDLGERYNRVDVELPGSGTVAEGELWVRTTEDMSAFLKKGEKIRIGRHKVQYLLHHGYHSSDTMPRSFTNPWHTWRTTQAKLSSHAKIRSNKFRLAYRWHEEDKERSVMYQTVSRAVYIKRMAKNKVGAKIGGFFSRAKGAARKKCTFCCLKCARLGFHQVAALTLARYPLIPVMNSGGGKKKGFFGKLQGKLMKLSPKEKALQKV